jgi:hypothetical protein
MDYMFRISSTKHGNDHVFVFIDRFSKIVILTPYKKIITTKATVNLFFQGVWVHFEIPQNVFLYHDSRFSSTIWSSFVDDCSYVRHSPAYKPVRCGSLQLCESFSSLQT